MVFEDVLLELCPYCALQSAFSNQECILRTIFVYCTLQDVYVMHAQKFRRDARLFSPFDTEASIAQHVHNFQRLRGVSVVY